MPDLQTKVAIVTGAARGIGRAIAFELARAGCDIVVTGLSASHILQVAGEIRNLGRKSLEVTADISLMPDVQMLIDRSLDCFGRIDILINNAGLVRDNLLGAMSEEEWNDVIRVNLNGAFHCIRAVTPPMIMQRSGKIVNITSVVGIKGNEGQANYSAAKAGLIGLTKSAARELASKNINVNAVAPGYIETEMTSGFSETKKVSLQKTIPLRRAGTPEDVAKMVAFLASVDANYITGQVICVDGGMNM